MKRSTPTDRVASALSKWSGLPPDQHDGDARGIVMADLFQIEKPKAARERAERIHKACLEIEKALASMTWQERVNFYRGFTTSRHTAGFKLKPNLWSAHSIGDDNPILAFIRALDDGAKHAIRAVDSTIDQHQHVSDKTNIRNDVVALHLGEIYFRIKQREPPKGGANGPFHRLLRNVYMALGRNVNDLRGPLRTVHVFRKNRK